LNLSDFSATEKSKFGAAKGELNMTLRQDDDDDNVVKDKGVLRVNLMMMDSLDPVQRAVVMAKGSGSVIDALAREMYGCGYVSDAAEKAALARDARNKQIQDAWRSPPNFPFDSERRDSKPLVIDATISDPRERAEALRALRFNQICDAWRMGR
jgi:hypothetical protein